MHKRFLILLPLCLLLSVPGAVLADEDGDNIDQNHLPPGYVTSNQAMIGGHATPDMICLVAEHAIKLKHYDEAILLCQKALQQDGDDCDIHLAYATALEAKLRRQTQKDPNLFLASVREWLLVARAERGDEKGLTNDKGIGIPKLAGEYQDEDRTIPAWAHIVSLVGFKPKPWETDAKYLGRVEKATMTAVKGRVVSDKQQQTVPQPTQVSGNPAQQKAEGPNARTF